MTQLLPNQTLTNFRGIHIRLKQHFRCTVPKQEGHHACYYIPKTQNVKHLLKVDYTYHRVETYSV